MSMQGGGHGGGGSGRCSWRRLDDRAISCISSFLTIGSIVNVDLALHLSGTLREEWRRNVSHLTNSTSATSGSSAGGTSGIIPPSFAASTSSETATASTTTCRGRGCSPLHNFTCDHSFSNASPAIATSACYCHCNCESCQLSSIKLLLSEPGSWLLGNLYLMESICLVFPITCYSEDVPILRSLLTSIISAIHKSTVDKLPKHIATLTIEVFFSKNIEVNFSDTVYLGPSDDSSSSNSGNVSSDVEHYEWIVDCFFADLCRLFDNGIDIPGDIRSKSSSCRGGRDSGDDDGDDGGGRSDFFSSLKTCRLVFDNYENDYEFRYDTSRFNPADHLVEFAGLKKKNSSSPVTKAGVKTLAPSLWVGLDESMLLASQKTSSYMNKIRLKCKNLKSFECRPIYFEDFNSLFLSNALSTRKVEQKLFNDNDVVFPSVATVNVNCLLIALTQYLQRYLSSKGRTFHSKEMFFAKVSNVIYTSSPPPNNIDALNHRINEEFSDLDLEDEAFIEYLSMYLIVKLLRASVFPKLQHLDIRLSSESSLLLFFNMLYSVYLFPDELAPQLGLGMGLGSEHGEKVIPALTLLTRQWILQSEFKSANFASKSADSLDSSVSTDPTLLSPISLPSHLSSYPIFSPSVAPILTGPRSVQCPASHVFDLVLDAKRCNSLSSFVGWNGYLIGVKVDYNIGSFTSALELTDEWNGLYKRVLGEYSRNNIEILDEASKSVIGKNIIHSLSIFPTINQICVNNWLPCKRFVSLLTRTYDLDLAYISDARNNSDSSSIQAWQSPMKLPSNRIALEVCPGFEDESFVQFLTVETDLMGDLLNQLSINYRSYVVHDCGDSGWNYKTSATTYCAIDGISRNECSSLFETAASSTPTSSIGNFDCTRCVIAGGSLDQCWQSEFFNHQSFADDLCIRSDMGTKSLSADGSSCYCYYYDSVDSFRMSEVLAKTLLSGKLRNLEQLHIRDNIFFDVSLNFSSFATSSLSAHQFFDDIGESLKDNACFFSNMFVSCPNLKQLCIFVKPCYHYLPIPDKSDGKEPDRSIALERQHKFVVNSIDKSMSRLRDCLLDRRRYIDRDKDRVNDREAHYRSGSCDVPVFKVVIEVSCLNMLGVLTQWQRDFDDKVSNANTSAASSSSVANKSCLTTHINLKKSRCSR